MNPQSSEERAAELLKALGMFDNSQDCIKDKKIIAQAIDTAKSEGRREGIAQAAEIASSFTVSKFDPRLAPMQDDEMKLAYKIANAIRALLTGEEG